MTESLFVLFFQCDRIWATSLCIYIKTWTHRNYASYNAY